MYSFLKWVDLIFEGIVQEIILRLQQFNKLSGLLFDSIEVFLIQPGFFQ